jgi:hypothetical protein
MIVSPGIRQSSPVYTSTACNLVGVTGGEMTKVFEWAGYPVVTWFPDGQRLVIEASPAVDQSTSTLFLVTLADLGVRKVMIGDATAPELRYPSFRP